MNAPATAGRVLVTGSTGFLGRHLLDLLAERQIETACLVRPGTDTRTLEGRQIIRVEADYDDPSSLDRALTGVGCVFHLGARIEGNDELAFFKANVEATQQLGRACVHADPPPRFVFASSIAAAGPSAGGRAKSETDPCEPVSAYGRSKLLAERALSALRPGLPLVMLRLPNILGAGQRQLESTMSLIRRRIVPVPGGRRRKTSICFARDAARALLLAAEGSAAAGDVFYVTDGGAYSWQDLVEPLARELAPGPVVRLRTPVLLGVAALMQSWAAIRRTPPTVTVSDILSTSRNDWLFDDARFRHEFGFVPVVKFEAEIARIARASRESLR
jgi:dihydroflavonol-4-reductase